MCCESVNDRCGVDQGCVGGVKWLGGWYGGGLGGGGGGVGAVQAPLSQPHRSCNFIIIQDFIYTTWTLMSLPTHTHTHTTKNTLGICQNGTLSSALCPESEQERSRKKIEWEKNREPQGDSARVCRAQGTLRYIWRCRHRCRHSSCGCVCSITRICCLLSLSLPQG